MSDVLTIERGGGGVATLWLSREEKRNAMGLDFFRELPERVAELDRDPEVRAVVLAAKGPHFSVGLDLMGVGQELGPMLAGGLARERRALLDLVHTWRRGFDAIVESDKPFVAAIHGACVGGGVDLVSACDVRVAARGTKLSVRETKIAIVADMGSLQRLRGIVGEGYLRELALTGRDVDAERALRMGLVNDVLDTPEAALTAARALATEMAQNAPLTVQGVKNVLRFTDRHGRDAGLDYVAAWNAGQLASHDLQEAIAAFMQKRTPSFKGE